MRRAKVLTIAISLILALGLSACGDFNQQDEAGDSEGQGFDQNVSYAEKRPETFINSSPPTPSYSDTATFTFSCNKKKCAFKCKLDDQPWEKCSSPKKYTGLSEGLHTFQVKAKNLKNNLWDKTPRSYQWVRYVTELSDSTILVDNLPNLQLSDTVGGTYIYNYTGTPPSLQAGDILLSGEGTGYLRKVASVQNKGASGQGNEGTLVVQTTQASLAEAFEKLNINYNHILTPSEVEHQEALREGVYFLAPIGATFYIGIDDVVIYDADGNKNTTYDQIVLNGGLSFSSELHFSIDIDWFSLEYLYFANTITETAEVSLSSSITLFQFEKEIELAKYYFTPITFTVGPVPVVLTPVLTVKVGVNGEISVSITTGVTQTASLTGGVKYENDEWGPVIEFSNDFDFQPPTLEFECSAKAYAGLDLDILLYSVVGPYIGAEGYLLLEADPFEIPWWSLYGGFAINGGVEIEVVDIINVGYEVNILDYRILLASAPPAKCGDDKCTQTEEDVHNCPEDCQGSCGDGICNLKFEYPECEIDCPYSCGNGLCDSLISENVTNCPQDCAGTCGDGTCNPYFENAGNCSLECPGICGDKICNSHFSETLDNCPWDCPGICGDGTCNEYFETPNTCATDCELEVIPISAGGWQTCGITDSGGAKCWGNNDYGQLGDGTTTSRNLPVNVSGLSSGVIQISSGWYHTCALTNAGAVKCWGRNFAGQLGDGTTVMRKTPVNVSGLSSGVLQISSGWNHTCALMDSGGVKCWGDNMRGQLGKENWPTLEKVPVNVSGLSSGVIAISAGGYHTCALTSTGMKCWGDNQYGQLGDGNSQTFSYNPVNVTGLPQGISSISAGGYHSCALTSGGAVKCWGRNESGQLGNKSWNNSAVPVDVFGLSAGITAISAGYYHTCAITNSGAVKCWGWNYSGQLGNGTNNDSYEPVNVYGLSGGTVGLSTGLSHSCASTSLGALKCWGTNWAGMLGNGTNTNSNVPVNVVGF